MRRASQKLLLSLLLPLTAGCSRADPPGASGSRQLTLSVGKVPAEEASPERLGTVEDDLPFSPTGLSLVSTAWRTWIYTDTGPKRTRLGYLRAGQVMDARGPVIRNDGCKEGWYRINPRGFVCTAKGATTNLDHPIARALAARPKRGAGFPYLYAMSQEQPPDRYFKLPSAGQMIHVEGEKVQDRAAAFVAQGRASGLFAELGIDETLPAYVAPGRALEKPYGVEQRERREVSAGRANPGGGFALVDAFLWNDRAFGVTTELDLIPLDRTRLRRDGEFAGVELLEGEALPVGFLVKGAVTYYEPLPDGRLQAIGEYRGKRAFKLTGREKDGLVETRDGKWIGKSALRIAEPRDGFPSVATGARRWIDVSVSKQMLVAYVGRRPVYATLISSGRGGLGPVGDDDPDGERTVRGTFMIHDKALTSTMNGDQDRSDSYALLDVPFVQYFHRGFALHGAYWHEEFGKQRSHGCINLSAKDSAWLFEWTDPPLPPGWHGVLNKERGTVVYVGY